MSFGLYAAGFAIVIAGLIDAAYLMHVPAHRIAVGAIILLGMGNVTGVKNTRHKDPPSESSIDRGEQVDLRVLRNLYIPREVT